MDDPKLVVDRACIPGRVDAHWGVVLMTRESAAGDGDDRVCIYVAVDAQCGVILVTWECAAGKRTGKYVIESI